MVYDCIVFGLLYTIFLIILHITAYNNPKKSEAGNELAIFWDESCQTLQEKMYREVIPKKTIH